MNKGKLIVGVALVFIVGVLVGSVGTRLYFQRHHSFFPGEHGSRTAFIMKRLSKDLSLTEEQKVAVQKIVEQTEEKLREYFLQRRPEIDSIMDDGFSQIRQELNDEQKKKLDELRERFERRRHAREGAFLKPPREKDKF
ncbi:MAG TPA: hypothetical protein VMT71_08505 [Syntrophorhabdales bacterium]|nr:hypothetical protein [Syntrophorhabdales bacterium]